MLRQQGLTGATSVLLVNSERHFCVTNGKPNTASDLIGERDLGQMVLRARNQE